MDKGMQDIGPGGQEAKGPGEDAEVAALEHSTPSLWSCWFTAAGDSTIDAALRDMYTRLDADIQKHSPTCWLSGRCCNFDAFDHRLYVTALEIAWVLRQVGAREVDPTGPCAYQQEKLCTIHTVRPLGCHLFFCQEGTQEWQYQMYESYLDELRKLHESHDLPYRYVEWREGLRDAMASGQLPVSSEISSEG
jgi:Fe-S-cluster containining protein